MIDQIETAYRLTMLHYLLGLLPRWEALLTLEALHETLSDLYWCGCNKYPKEDYGICQPCYKE